jgi:hypothetical protein
MNGLALAIVQSDGRKGNITLTASSSGLQSNNIIIATK